MKKEYEALFTPWKIGNCEIKNRIVQTSMGGTSIFGWCEPNHFDEEAAKFLLERARNNAGLILPGIACIKDQTGGKWLYQGKEKFKQLKTFMDEFHKTGCKMFVQLAAGMGRSFSMSELAVKLYNNPEMAKKYKKLLDVDYLTRSASRTENRWGDGCYSKPFTVRQIQQIVDAFAKTAKLCKDAGVDGIEVHAVHEGYMLDQFAMKYTNQRKDQYGGSLTNRLRFTCEIVKAIKKVCGKDYPVTLRYSVVSYTKDFRKGALPGEKYKEVGRDMKESEKAVKILQRAGYDMLNCDNGTYDAWYWSHPPVYMPNNCNLEDVEHIKKFVDIPVVCAGKMTPAVAAKAIAEGKLDGMGVARQFLVDPEWITKLMEGREEDIKPCINCHNACFNLCKHGKSANDQDHEDTAGMARCALNPRTMQTDVYYIQKTDSPKNVAIIGGGIGGMEAALVLKERGHNPVIYEKGTELGGTFINAAAFSFKEHDKKLIEWYRLQIKKNDICVKFNTEIKDIKSLNADAVIVATGGQANRPAIPGLKEYSIEPTEYLSGKKKADGTVIIVGGGLTGCEIAYERALHGQKSIVVEMLDDLVSAKGVCLANSSYLREALALYKVPVYLNTKLLQINEDKSIKVQDAEGKEFTIKGDSVITCMGYHSDPVAQEGVYIVGDANKVGNLRTVVWSAWDAAMKI